MDSPSSFLHRTYLGGKRLLEPIRRSYTARACLVVGLTMFVLNLVPGTWYFLRMEQVRAERQAIALEWQQCEEERIQAEKEAQEEAKRLAQEEADRRAKLEADRLAKEQAERLAKEKAEEANRWAENERKKLEQEKREREKWSGKLLVLVIWTADMLRQAGPSVTSAEIPAASAKSAAGPRRQSRRRESYREHLFRELTRIQTECGPRLVGKTIFLVSPGAALQPWNAAAGPQSLVPFQANDIQNAFSRAFEAIEQVPANAINENFSTMLIWRSDADPQEDRKQTVHAPANRTLTIVWISLHSSRRDTRMSEWFKGPKSTLHGMDPAALEPGALNLIDMLSR